MSADSNPVAEPTIFSAVITPNRSLDRFGFIVLMSLVSFVSFVGGISRHHDKAVPLLCYVLDHTRPSLTLSHIGDFARFLRWVRRCLRAAAA